jgi:hypothetical protein
MAFLVTTATLLRVSDFPNGALLRRQWLLGAVPGVIEHGSESAMDRPFFFAGETGHTHALRCCTKAHNLEHKSGGAGGGLVDKKERATVAFLLETPYLMREGWG